METTVTKINHEELSIILEVAAYHNHAIAITIPRSQKMYVKRNREFRSDKWADVILGGGYVYVWDMYADADSLEDKRSERAVTFDEEDHSIAYRLDLENVLAGLSKDAGLACKVIEGDGDAADAYDLVQYMMFDDIIYG